VVTTWGEIMKKNKLIIFLSILVLLTVFLQGCPSPTTSERHPTNQPNTTWVTDDGKVTFCVGSDDSLSPLYGVVETENGSVEIVISMSSLTSFVAISFNDAGQTQTINQPITSFAHGQGRTNSKDEFIIEITFAECYFENGELLVFHRTD